MLLALTSKQLNLLLWAAGTLVALIIVIVAAFLLFRRFSCCGRADACDTESFTLAEIRTMKEQGQISQKEFDKLKDQIVQENQQG